MQTLGAKPYSLNNWHGHYVRLITEAHGSPEGAEEILKASSNLIRSPKRWLIALEAHRDESLNRRTPLVSVRVMYELADRLGIPIIDPVPHKGDSEVLQAAQKELGVSDRGITTATFFQTILFMNSEAKRQGQSIARAFELSLEARSIMHRISKEELRKIVIRKANELLGFRESRARFVDLMNQVETSLAFHRNKIGQRRLLEALNEFPDRPNILALVGYQHSEIFDQPIPSEYYERAKAAGLSPAGAALKENDLNQLLAELFHAGILSLREPRSEVREVGEVKDEAVVKGVDKEAVNLKSEISAALLGGQNLKLNRSDLVLSQHYLHFLILLSAAAKLPTAIAKTYVRQLIQQAVILGIYTQTRKGVPIAMLLEKAEINAESALALALSQISETARRVIDHRLSLPENAAELDSIVLKALRDPKLEYVLVTVATTEQVNDFMNELRAYAKSTYGAFPDNIKVEVVESVETLHSAVQKLISERPDVVTGFVSQDEEFLHRLGYQKLLRVIGSKDKALQLATVLITAERLLEDLPLDILAQIQTASSIDPSNRFSALAEELRARLSVQIAA